MGFSNTYFVFIIDNRKFSTYYALNIRHDMIKLLEGNIDKTFSDINRSIIFSGQSPKAIEIKARM